MQPALQTVTVLPPARKADQFYTVKEAAGILKVSQDTVRRMIRSGTIRAKQITPRVRRISQKELDRIAEDQF